MRGFLLIGLFFTGILAGFAQNEQLAQKYLDQGEYEKALSTYKNLYTQQPNNYNYFQGLVSSYQQLENFKEAEALLRERLQTSGDNPGVLIDLGHNFELQKLHQQAIQYYDVALNSLQDKPNYIYTVARNFQKYSLLDYAVKAYKIGIDETPEMKYQLPLARIYGEQGNLEEMFNAYLDFMQAEPDMGMNLIREFDKYITEDSSNPANDVLRKLLIKRLQKDPSIFYTQFLGWLYIQQKDYGKAFVQEKAVYKRQNQDLGRILQLGIIAKSEGDLEAAQKIILFIVEETPATNIRLQAQQLLLNIKVETASEKDYSQIEKEYASMVEKYQNEDEILGIKIDYANFLAFKAGKIGAAENLLNKIPLERKSAFQKAAIKMALADILVLDEKFNQALINYSQVGNLVKNNEVAENALFKVAKTSYFKGDFDWAQTQLKVLKASVTQLIANDAMELSLLIQENTQEDSSQTALKLYARADLLSFQQKPEEAITILQQILTQHKGEKIEDEALLKQAKLFETLGEYPKAEENYLKILQFYAKDILADNAAFGLARLYNQKLNEPDKAKDFYEKIIFNYPDSIYFVDARKEYRKLRGDTIQ